jgi:hypothetical protein
MVDPESCTPVCFEGYIQATCNPEGSPVDQVPWSATFTPTPSCNLYSLQCTAPLGFCALIPAATMGLNCNGTARPDVGPLVNFSAGLNICAQSIIPNLPAGYVMTNAGAQCCDCTDYEISITTDPNCTFPCSVDGTILYYTDCNTKELIAVPFFGNQSFLFNQCAVTDTVHLIVGPQALISVTLLGPCP